MKYFINGIMVVEGSGDASYLSSFIDSEYVITNGLDVPDEELEYLVEASKKVPIIIMTDPDEAGENIRHRVHQKVDGHDVVVDSTKCNKNGKHGVAECTKEEIINKLNIFFDKSKKEIEFVSKNFFKVNDYDKEDIYLFIRKKFHLGKCNRKQLIRRLNTLEIAEEELNKTIKEYLKDGNQ